MKILQREMATNPGNIGGYKNTPYTGKRREWNTSHKREPGSNSKWHEKDIYTEGFLQDLYDLATNDTDGPSAMNTFEDWIKPHTSEDLYKSVCYVLSNKVTDETVREAVNMFLPVKGYASAPKGIDHTLFDKYKRQMEDAVIEYCTTDALDIIKRLQKDYKLEELDGEKIYGTILSKVLTTEYDIQSKIKSMYNKFKEECKTAPSPKEDKNNISTANTIIKELKKSFPTVDEATLTQAAMDFLTSEFGISSLKQLLNGGE